MKGWRTMAMFGGGLGVWLSVWANPAPMLAETVVSPVLTLPHRPAQERQRDRYRHPAEVLAFFEITPRSRVLEVWPGAGWYSAILAPLLREQGTYYAAHFAEDSERAFFRRSRAQFIQRLQQHPEVFDRVQLVALEPPRVNQALPNGQVDHVLTFRNVHNWLQSGTAPAMFAAFAQALAPGGILGVVEHRALPGTTLTEMIERGYVTEALVIELAEQQGLVLIGRSEINANPRDDREGEAGVWRLPPTLRLGEQDRERWMAIGESDRMTLKFRKPE